MSDFLIFKAAFNNSATPAIGTYTAEGATALFNMNASLSPDYYLYNTADDTAVQWFVPTAETTDFEFVADILTRQWTNRVTYFIIADSPGTTRLRMWSQNDNWHFENSDSIATTGDPEYIGVVNPTTSGGFGVFHRFRVRVRKLTASSSSVEVYVDGTLKLTATAGAALVTCAKIGFVGGVNTFGPGTGAGIKNAYVYDLSGGDVIDRGVLSGAFNRFISWAKGIFATQDNAVLRSGGNLMTGSSLGRVDDTGVFQVCGGQTGADGGSISLTGKNRGTADGAVELTAYDGVNSTKAQILPDGTMTVTYPDMTVKNVAMQEDIGSSQLSQIASKTIAPGQGNGNSWSFTCTANKPIYIEGSFYITDTGGSITLSSGGNVVISAIAGNPGKVWRNTVLWGYSGEGKNVTYYLGSIIHPTSTTITISIYLLGGGSYASFYAYQ